MTYQEWKNQIKPEKKLRTYQHIDDALDLGIDETFKRVVHVIEDMKNHQFLPFIKREDIQIRFRKDKDGETRRSTKLRPIMYASHLDAHIYSYYNYILQIKYEKYIEDLNISSNVTAYRKIKLHDTSKGKSNIHFAKEVFDYIQTQSECIIITQDITGFFDNLNHSILKKMICTICNIEKLDESFYKVFRSLTAYRYIEYSDFIDKKIKGKTKNNKYAIYNSLKGILYENKKNIGIPQGSPISGLLANMYMIDFDLAMKSFFPDIFYRRYSDDLVFICRSDQKDALSLFINSKINESRLEINASKSYISYFKKINEGLICEKVTDGLDKQKSRNYVDYLGFEFNGKNILLRKNTIQKLKRKQMNKTRKQILNNIKPIRRSPKKDIVKKTKNRNNYFKKTLEIINNQAIDKQVLGVVRDRNNIKKRRKKI